MGGKGANAQKRRRKKIKKAPDEGLEGCGGLACERLAGTKPVARQGMGSRSS
jgi:hypothetical protein